MLEFTLPAEAARTRAPVSNADGAGRTRTGHKLPGLYLDKDVL